MTSKPPAHLGRAGCGLWRSVVERSDGDRRRMLVLDPVEAVALEAACACADRVVALEAVLAADGPMTSTAAGAPKVSPVLAEIRAQTTMMVSLLGAVAVPDEATGKPSTAASRRGKGAADHRWNRVRREREAAELRVAGGPLE